MPDLAAALEKRLNEPRVRALLRAGRLARVLFHYPKRTVLGRLAGTRRMTENRLFWAAPFWTRGSVPGLAATGLLIDEDEIGLTRFLVHRLGPDDVFLDVGSHFGFYAVLAEEAIGGGSVRVHAFEPARGTREVTLRNAAGRRIQVVGAALSDHEGEATLSVVDGATGSSSLHPEFIESQELGRAVGAETVALTTLDAWCAKTGVVPTVMKVDAEGSEPEVVAGGAGTISRHRPVIVMEFWPAALSGAHVRALEKLEALGYSFGQIGPDGRLAPRDLAYFRGAASSGILACTPL